MGVAYVAITTSGGEIARELDSVANVITVPVNVKLKRKSEHEQINCRESEKQLTCCSE